jgi:hypothetical protein
MDIEHWKEATQPTDLAFIASAARKSRSEIKLRDLTTAERALFEQAKQKEISCWIETDTVRRILRKQLSPEQILRCRWIFTWKDPDPGSSNQKAKARLVVLGFEDPDLETIPRDSPTLQKDSRSLILQYLACRKWVLRSFDISTAFLRGKGDQRILGLEPTPELRQALKLSEDEICQLLGGAYGLVNAPYLFFQELKKKMLELGFTQCPLDPCLFVLVGKNKQMHGVVGFHVDTVYVVVTMFL